MPRIQTEDEFRAVLTGASPGFDRSRRRMQHIPSPPRCKLCAAPFAGPGGAVLRHFGFGRFAGNPALCENCIRGYTNRKVRGAEIPLTLLFADIRGSTGIGERLWPNESPGVPRALLPDRVGRDPSSRRDRRQARRRRGRRAVHRRHRGPAHAAAGIAAARDLLGRCGAPDATPMGPIPVGAAVHTGEAYVGIVGDKDRAMDFTALGDPVNTAARLASGAAAGELLISADAARAAGMASESLETRTLDVRGRTEPVEVLVEAVARPG
jgi:adenylate cyclase